MSSMATSSLRTSLRRAASCSRYFSASASCSASASIPSKLEISPKAELPAHKMRALVDLYQQADTFITKDTLSQRIDEAFIHRANDPTKRDIRQDKSMRALEIEVVQRQANPKFAASSHAVAQNSKGQRYNPNMNWSSQRDHREYMVFKTLHGIVEPARPGYDALMDEFEQVKEELELEKGKNSEER